MINSIIEAVSVALNNEFGDDYEIHMEEMEQGLKESCFFIQCLKPTNELFRGIRYFITCPLCIQYFPSTQEKQRECNSVAERMYQCLEYVILDGDDRPMRGKKMKYEVVDGVLNFFVHYDCFVHKAAERQESMEGMMTQTNVKEGG